MKSLAHCGMLSPPSCRTTATAPREEAPVIARRAPGVITPHVLALGRWVLAGVLLGWMARRELWQHRQELRLHAARYLALGACGMWICGAWVYLGGESTGGMNISLIYASAPVMIAVGSVLWLGEHLSKRQILGVILAMTGVVHVVVKGEWAHLSQVQLVPGDLWIVAASLSWAAYALLQKRWPTSLSPTAQLACICWGGVAVLLPFAIWELSLASTPAPTPHAWFLMAITALLPGVGAFGACAEGLWSIPDMVEALDERVMIDGVPFLGICVGMQLMATPDFEAAPSNDAGWLAHLGVMVDDLEAALKAAEPWGVKALPQGRNWLQLPDGLAVELIQAAPGSVEQVLQVNPRAQ